mmetsp:Transcript_20074/g.28848  ORF Transcript_20074/g.28848 Transcript_20074/m.28848 type:complete len:390 (+) Transcript_20074:81-1250(+)
MVVSLASFIVACLLLGMSRAVLSPSELDQLYIQGQQRYSGDSCILHDMDAIMKEVERNANKAVLTTTPCLEVRSLGNSLSIYVESRICANISGLHFLAWGESAQSSLIGSLPRTVYNPSARSESAAQAKSMCPCKVNICHEHQMSLMHSKYIMVRDILRPAIDSYYASMLMRDNSYLSPSSAWKVTLRHPTDERSKLPLVPDAAIHYRCGDNTVGHYGFLSFPAFKNRIPSGVRYIYVLAESASRNASPSRVRRCDSILAALWEYLSSTFPRANVLVLRGQNMFDDFTRLTLANTTICSVSTFCLFPAFASTNTVYFPISRLVAKATAPKYDSNFHWLDKFPDESVFPGVDALRIKDNRVLIQKLMKPQGKRPLPPSYVLHPRVASLKS